jgi:hypothetical protein
VSSLFALLGIEAWKPVLGALVLPPVPWLVLVLIHGSRSCCTSCSASRRAAEAFRPEFAR